jgi:hypothetical protein
MSGSAVKKMPSSHEHREARKRRSTGRTARLEAELKANLRKRRDQARARAETRPDRQAPGDPADDKDET